MLSLNIVRTRNPLKNSPTDLTKIGNFIDGQICKIANTSQNIQFGPKCDFNLLKYIKNALQ